MFTESQKIKAENSLTEWVRKSMDDGASVLSIERMLVEKLHYIIKGLAVSEIEQEKYEEAQFLKCCEYLKHRFDINVSVSNLKQHIKNDHILSDIMTGAYRNTDVIEEIADIISNAIVGLSMPCYGDSDAVKTAFNFRARKMGFID